MTTPYQRGANFERKCLKELAKRPEYIYAMRSAGSHSIVDIVAFFYPEEGHVIIGANHETWLIQAKLSGRASKTTLDMLRDLASECEAVPVLASQGKGQINFDILTEV